jgi:hypothetical protein
VSGDLTRRVFGTSRQPRLGSTLSVVVLAALALLFLLLSSWVLFAVFAVLAGIALFVRAVRRSTGQ